MNFLIDALSQYAIAYVVPAALAFILGKLLWAVNKAADAITKETGIKIDTAQRNKLHAAVQSHVGSIAVKVLADGRVTPDEVLKAVTDEIRSSLPERVKYTNPGTVLATKADAKSIVDIAAQYAPAAIEAARKAFK